VRRVLRIAVVRSLDGYATCCGPNDTGNGDYADAMEAAICFHIEAGHIPADKCWAVVDLPEVRGVIPEFQAMHEEASA